MAVRRDRRWWRERWVARHYAEIKSPKLLEGQMEHLGWSCAALAKAVERERQRDGSARGCSRQMISLLKNGTLRTCEPDLAGIIEQVLGVAPQTLFSVLPKSHDKRETAKGEAA